MRAYSLSPCIHISLWSGFQGVHRKENALSFYVREMVSATRWALDEMYRDDVP